MRPKGYWNFETLKAEALKYSSKREFQLKSGSAYNASGRLKLRDLICAHMVEIKKPNGHWSLERLKVEALKYSSRQEFQQKNGAAYKAAGEIKCRDEICAHMAKVKQGGFNEQVQRVRRGAV